MSTVGNTRVQEGTSLVNFIEVSPDADRFTAVPSTPLLDTAVINDDRKVAICAASPAVTSPSTTAVPTLKDFALIKVLGAGSFGTVYLAQHKESGVRVALKAIRKVPRSKDATDWAPKKLRERALRSRSQLGRESEGIVSSALGEVTALLRTKCMKSVLCILASFQDLGRYYIATVSVLAILSFLFRQPHLRTQEYFPGGDLASELVCFGKFPLDRVRFYAADLVCLNLFIPM